MEREARETRERASNASKARAERAARTARAGATRQGTEARREWREPPEDRNSKPVRSPTPLLGRFAAYAGGLRWESVSVTSFPFRPYDRIALLGKASEIHAKIAPGTKITYSTWLLALPGAESPYVTWCQGLPGANSMYVTWFSGLPGAKSTYFMRFPGLWAPRR